MQHLTERIMAFSCNSFVTLIINNISFESYQRNHSSQKQIYFLKLRKLIQNPCTHLLLYYSLYVFPF